MEVSHHALRAITLEKLTRDNSRCCMPPERTPGLYIGFDDTGTPRYLGISLTDVQARSSHLVDKPSKNPKIEAYKSKGRRIEVRVLRMPGIDSAALADLETKLIQAIGREDEAKGPLWNRIDRFGVFSDEIRYGRAKTAALTGKRRRAGRKANQTKGPEGRSAAAIKAAQTRARKRTPR